MKRKIELLAPGGDVNAIKAAILAGANAIYCGLDRFNARNRATNISIEDLQGILRLAHKYDCEIFITLNIVIVENEIPALVNLLNSLVNTNIDGLIVQDLGMLYLLNKYYKSLDVHASTQMTTHNKGQIKFLSKFDVSRVNLSRELNIQEIKSLSEFGQKHNVLTEVFVHGSNCISFSGICYMSSVHGGNSGNRGRCSQPCRDRYLKTSEGKDYPLNLKDNSAYFDIKELYDAGVYSLKIEGRIKKADYVYTVVDAWKKNIQSLYEQKKGNTDNSALYKVFNRDFSNTLLKGDIDKTMFIDNPRDYSIQHLNDLMPEASAAQLEKAHLALYKEKDDIKAFVEREIETVSVDKGFLIISISGKYDEFLKVSVKTPTTSFDIFSETKLVNKGLQTLNKEMILKRFKALNETEYFIKELNVDDLANGLFISFNELSSLKKRLLYILNDSTEYIEPIDLPDLKENNNEIIPQLSILLSSVDDIKIYKDTKANIYFQLPNSFKNNLNEYVALFNDNETLIPYFPSVIIDEDYEVAIEFLRQVNPKRIVTNNTGIGYEAFKLDIDWIAGPQLNLTNSYSLLCLKEELNCSGAFLSNELNRNQIKQIKCPDNFELHYSIYHPIVLMTSRQCLFHQVIGCEKNKVDNTCIENCTKTTTITNMKKNDFFIEKSKGNYHKVYNQENFLNTTITKDLAHVFSSYMIDLRDIETGTKFSLDKLKLIQMFKSVINDEVDSEERLKACLVSHTSGQYKKGI